MISLVVISKDEPALDDTLTALREQVAESRDVPGEIIVVDASDGRLDDIRRAHEPVVQWIRFERPPGTGVTIPHQRNVGVRAAQGDIIVFTDSGCLPAPGWLAALTAPIRNGAEDVTAGPVDAASEGVDPYSGSEARYRTPDGYLTECPTINLAFRRTAFDAIGGFDERFAYGSDSDFSWRLVDAGFRILAVPDAIVRHDWGTGRRQLRRSYLYGKARARLYRKHGARRRRVLREDPVVVIYPLFLLGLPLTFVFPLYPFLLLIPAWRNRSIGGARVLMDHLAFGAGVLAELIGR
jgi:GT2 family glycosyltransferase